eukprot:g29821.t1
MADVAARLLADRRTSNITVYIVDPWLRKAVTIGHSKEKRKTELQALVRLEESKVCPPVFTDLQALPFRSKTCSAMPVLTPNRTRIWAVLQVTLEERTTRKWGVEPCEQILPVLFGRAAVKAKRSLFNWMSAFGSGLKDS